MLNHIWKWIEAHQQILQWSVVLSIIMIVLAMLIIPIRIILLPQDYLLKKDDRTPFLTKLANKPYLIFKNLLGILLILAGIAMLILPGQGVIVLIIGLSLMNIPAKHRLMLRMMGHPRILRAINRLRSRANKPQLETPGRPD